MAFCIVFGTTAFNDRLKGYENMTCQCHRCGNWSGVLATNREWFTVCWLPIIPLNSKQTQVQCGICHAGEDIRNRPDVQAQMQGRPTQGNAGGGPQGWGGGPPPPEQAHGGQQYQYR